MGDGSLVKVIGRAGAGKGEFDFNFGGICATSRGSLLVAEFGNNRVQVRVRVAYL